MKILDRSIEIARALYPNHNDNRRCFHWSIAWNKSKLIAIGENKDRTSPRNLYNQNRNGFPIQTKGICSEMALFTKIKNQYDVNWKKIKIVNVRIGRDGEVKNSAGCTFCFNLFRYLEVPFIYHTTSDGFKIQYFS